MSSRRQAGFAAGRGWGGQGGGPAGQGPGSGTVCKGQCGLGPGMLSLSRGRRMKPAAGRLSRGDRGGTGILGLGAELIGSAHGLEVGERGHG